MMPAPSQRRACSETVAASAVRPPIKMMRSMAAGQGHAAEEGREKSRSDGKRQKISHWNRRYG